MTAHDHVEHPLVLVAELVLIELPEAHPRLQHDVAGARLEIAAENLHERGFAGAVRADQTIAVAVGELDRDVLEQRLGAELHGDVGGREHGIQEFEISQSGRRSRFSGPINAGAILAEPGNGRSGFSGARFSPCKSRPAALQRGQDGLRLRCRAHHKKGAPRGCVGRPIRPNNPFISSSIPLFLVDELGHPRHAQSGHIVVAGRRRREAAGDWRCS